MGYERRGKFEEGPAAGGWPCSHWVVCTSWSHFSGKNQKSNSIWRRILYIVTYEKSGGCPGTRNLGGQVIRVGIPLTPSRPCFPSFVLRWALPIWVQDNSQQIQGIHSILFFQNPKRAQQERKSFSSSVGFPFHILSLIGPPHVMSSTLSQPL